MKSITILLAAAILLTRCASTTMTQATPPAAAVSQAQAPMTTASDYTQELELQKLGKLMVAKAITREDYATIKRAIVTKKYDYSNSIVDQIIGLKDLTDASLITVNEYESQKGKLISGE